MFSVIVRRSTLTIRSTIGISRKRPGPFGSGRRRPRRKMIPRSYSLATLTAANRNSSTRIRTMTTTMMAAVMSAPYSFDRLAGRAKPGRSLALRAGNCQARRDGAGARSPGCGHGRPREGRTGVDAAGQPLALRLPCLPELAPYRDEPVSADLPVRADDRLRPDRRRAAPDLD